MKNELLIRVHKNGRIGFEARVLFHLVFMTLNSDPSYFKATKKRNRISNFYQFGDHVFLMYSYVH